MLLIDIPMYIVGVWIVIMVIFLFSVSPWLFKELGKLSWLVVKFVLTSSVLVVVAVVYGIAAGIGFVIGKCYEMVKGLGSF